MPNKMRYNKRIGKQSMVDLIYEAYYAENRTPHQTTLLAAIDDYLSFNVIIKYWIILGFNIADEYCRRELFMLLARNENGGSASLLYSALIDGGLGINQSIEQFLTAMAAMASEHPEYNCDAIIAALGKVLDVRLKDVFRRKIDQYCESRGEFLFPHSQYEEFYAAHCVDDFVKAKLKLKKNDSD